jgi:beta-N-acetylhexosaminidase
MSDERHHLVATSDRMSDAAASGDLRRLAAACVWPSFRGPTAPSWFLELLDSGLGGVVLFGSNIATADQLLELTTQLAHGRPGLPIALDEEGGDVTRLHARTGAWSPGNLALGAVDDVALTEQVAAAMARELRACGVTVTLAPVADLLLDLENPIVGTRSFGTAAAGVARHVAAFVRATQGEGVGACVKHFPGHGATRADSHHELPHVDVDRDVLEARELVPFRAAIDAGVQCVMVGHLLVPALDGAVATFSRAIATDLLREELTFTGLVVSDALDMAGASQDVGVAEAAVRALAAGVDALCLGPVPDAGDVATVLEAIVSATRDGRLSAERLAQAADRGSTLSAWLAASRAGPAATADGSAPTLVDTQLGLAAARRALRARGPVTPQRGAVVMELRPQSSIAAGSVAWGMHDALRSVGDLPLFVALDSSYAALDSALAAARGRPLIVVSRDAIHHAWQRAVLARVTTERPDVIVVELGVAGEPPPARTVIVTNGASRASTVAAAELLTGLTADGMRAFTPTRQAQSVVSMREGDS